MTKNILLEETIRTIRNALYDFMEIPDHNYDSKVNELTFYILAIMKVSESKFNKFPNITKFLSENDFMFGPLSSYSYYPYTPGVRFSNDNDSFDVIHAYTPWDNQQGLTRSLETLTHQEEDCLRGIGKYYAQMALTPPTGYSDFEEEYNRAKTDQEKKNVLLYYDIWYKNDIFKEEYSLILGYDPEESDRTPPSIKITSEWGLTDYDVCIIPNETIDEALLANKSVFKKIFDKNKDSSLELEF